MNELLNVLLGMALSFAIVLGLAGLAGLIVGLVVWRRVEHVAAQTSLAFSNVGAHLNQVQGLAQNASDGVELLMDDIERHPGQVEVHRVH